MSKSSRIIGEEPLDCWCQKVLKEMENLSTADVKRFWKNWRTNRLLVSKDSKGIGLTIKADQSLQEWVGLAVRLTNPEIKESNDLISKDSKGIGLTIKADQSLEEWVGLAVRLTNPGQRTFWLCCQKVQKIKRIGLTSKLTNPFKEPFDSIVKKFPKNQKNGESLDCKL